MFPHKIPRLRPPWADSARNDVSNMYFYKYKKLMRQLGRRGAMSEAEKSAVRSRILAEIRQSPAWQQAVFYAEPQLNWAQKLLFSKALQPVGVTIIVIGLAFSGGSIVMVASAQGSLPGDTLYPVKIGIEKAQLSLTFSETRQAQLEMSFAASRLDEMNQLITKDGNTSQVAANVGQAVRHFNSSLNSVQKKLSSAKIQADKKNAKSLAVAVAKTGSDETLLKLQDKITDIEKKIDQIVIDQATLKEAKEVLGQTASTSEESLSIIRADTTNKNIEDVKVILDNKDNGKFRDVISKVEETKALVEATKQAVDSILDK